MRQSHGTRIVRRLLTRNRDKLIVLTADNGYDWKRRPHKHLVEGGRPVIEQRTFGWHGIANRVLLDETTYQHRSSIEATGFALRRNYGKIVRARTWVGRFVNSASSVPPEPSNERVATQARDCRRLTKAQESSGRWPPIRRTEGRTVAQPTRAGYSGHPLEPIMGGRGFNRAGDAMGGVPGRNSQSA